VEPAGADEADARSHASVGPADLDELLQREDLAVIVTDLGGAVTGWNAGAERLYGWTPSEVLGQPITAFTVGPEDETVAENIMDAVRSTGRWEGAFWVRRKDGRRFLAEVREAMISDAHGAPIGLVGVSVEAELDDPW
jgi:PAS domain S-box-containing protein